MIELPFFQDHKDWNFEIGYCDLFVIWFLGIVFFICYSFIVQKMHRFQKIAFQA